jgi:hypothetical protein
MLYAGINCSITWRNGTSGNGSRVGVSEGETRNRRSEDRNGVRIVYSRADQKGLEAENLSIKFRAQFPEILSIIFGTQERPTDQEVSQRLYNITASWFEPEQAEVWGTKIAERENDGDTNGFLRWAGPNTNVEDVPVGKMHSIFPRAFMAVQESDVSVFMKC